MATMPPEISPDMGAMLAAPEAEGTTVCITMLPDGSFKVYAEGAEEDMPGAEPMTEEQESAGAQTAGSMDEAFKLARGMLEGGAGEGMSVEQAFQGGFNGDTAGEKY